MPPTVLKLNAPLLALLVAGGCTRKLDITVELFWPSSPDPFERVETVRMRGLVAGELITLGEDRWDQGPIALPTAIDPTVERLVVEGIGSGGEVLASGATPPLDLLGRAPDGPLSLFFSQVGVLSELPDRATPRFGGSAAVSLGDGRVLAFGGRDANGCMIEATEVFSLEGVEAGPSLPGGRAGRFFFDRLPDGRVLVIGGEIAPDCGASQLAEEVAILDLSSGEARFARLNPEALRPGAAVAAVSSALAIIGGGDGDPIPSALVHRFDPTTLEFNRIGNLESPRARASAAAISDQRVVFVGGRSSTSTSSALDTATVFVPERGSPLADQIPLGRRAIEPSVITLRSGAVLVAGGVGDDGASDRVDAVVVRTERDFPIGDASAVARLDSPVARGGSIELGDGSVLLLPDEAGDPHWIRFLPSRAIAIPSPGSRLVGGRTVDGRALLMAEDGTVSSFNPGIAAALGVFGSGGELAMGPQELGIVPLRPSAWERTEAGLSGFRPALAGNLFPEEMAVLIEHAAGDFSIAFDLSLEGLAKAAIAFGIADDRFDYVVLAGATFVERAPSGASRGKIACTAAETRILAEPGFHRVRVERTAARVRVDVGADGVVELTCNTPRPEAGRIALAIVTGRATFEGLELR
jgi:hypothetical protein